jgi:hypothetical protein
MIIRTVEDARENLRRILWDIRNNQPSDPATLEAAKAAVERLRVDEQLARLNEEAPSERDRPDLARVSVGA